ncbi:maleylpyruvate isomerase family mycothiol-dependent enzyme [Nonomuraea sp. LPB2021202275-12-8]|uniref:maleylpyruvate isomerase family mycothiol-dependent enzyme n=1 Tax=Nonomuraea sp. LPB2021202275-12-8 TaxID=3120159 RepID=UPI00300C600B
MTDSYLYNGQSADDHVGSCPDCSAAITLLDQPDPAAVPPARLRESVLSKARRRRAPAEVGVAEVAVPYAEQVALMDELLAELSVRQWNSPTARHGTVRGMIEHLAANDAPVAWFLGVRAPEPDPAYRRWREQAGSLLQRVSASTGALLGAEVELAGATPARGSLRHALIQRTFETWTHADDVRRQTGRPPEAPPGDHVRMIAEFGLAMLPRAVRGPRRDVSVTFVLTGPGGGTWTVPLSSASDRVAVLLAADMVDFCRLLANRWKPGCFPYAAEGDPALAREVVRAAATLGCD